MLRGCTSTAATLRVGSLGLVIAARKSIRQEKRGQRGDKGATVKAGREGIHSQVCCALKDDGQVSSRNLSDDPVDPFRSEAPSMPYETLDCQI
jgi:hypothetical protein